MRSGLARNCGYAGMGDLECAMDNHVLSSCTDFQLQFDNLQSRSSMEAKGLIKKQTTLHLLHTFAVGRHLSTENRRHS